ncbi:MAG TPA: hypothetical protein VM715_03230, partial [Candidatus Acidoferrum sp.]|nr:hypothetical protein [Candidatus Acidoferrum sp.]
DADTLNVLDIYAASEQPIDGITGETLAGKIRESSGKQVQYVNSFPAAIESASSSAQEGDMILTLGAGSVSQLGPMILDKLNAGG